MYLALSQNVLWRRATIRQIHSLHSIGLAINRAACSHALYTSGGASPKKLFACDVAADNSAVRAFIVVR